MDKHVSGEKRKKRNVPEEILLPEQHTHVLG